MINLISVRLRWFWGAAGLLLTTLSLVSCSGSGWRGDSPVSHALSLVAGHADGYGNVDGAVAIASFNYPSGVAVDAAGNVYVAEFVNCRIRKITPAGVVSTLAGSGSAGNADGTGSAASFDGPNSVATDAAGNVYVADVNNNLIRKITPAGVVSTLAGSGSAGNADGAALFASFDSPQGIAADAAGNVYVADVNNNRIRKISTAGVVSTVAGSGSAGSANGAALSASFNGPAAVAVDAAGNIFVADTRNHLIRKVSTAGVVSTVAGSGSAGNVNATGTAASFNNPIGLSVDSSGLLYVADLNNHSIRQVSAIGVVTTLAGTGSVGTADGAAASAAFNRPQSVALDSNGNVYVADTYNHAIRQITPAAQVLTYAGHAAAVAGQTDGIGRAAAFNGPIGAATDSDGNVYIADTANHLIRKITPAGVVSTLTGTGSAGAANGAALAASFDGPQGVAVDAAGNVYVADTNNNTVRKISISGVVSTWAGSGSAGSTNATGLSASFDGPQGVAVDAAGNVYVADTNNNLIRKISPARVVSTLAGSGSAGSANGAGATASFDGPDSVATDAAGYVYVADANNNLIRKITPAGIVSTLAGSGSAGNADGVGVAASFDGPQGIALDTAGNLFVSDSNNHLIRQVATDGTVSTVVGVRGLFGFVPGALPGVIRNPKGLAVSADSVYFILGAGAAGDSGGVAVASGVAQQ